MRKKKKKREDQKGSQNSIKDLVGQSIPVLRHHDMTTRILTLPRFIYVHDIPTIFFYNVFSSAKPFGQNREVPLSGGALLYTLSSSI